MISVLVLLVFVIVGILTALKTKGSMFTTEQDRWGDNREKLNPSWIAKIVGIFIVGIAVSMFQPFSVEKIDAGHKGLKINLVGDQRGVSSYQYKTGWVLYNTWTEQVLEFPTYQQHIEYEDQAVILKGGFSATIKPTCKYLGGR